MGQVLKRHRQGAGVRRQAVEPQLGGNCASFRFGDLPPDVAPAGGGARARMIRADLERRPGCADHRLDRGPGGGLPRAPRPVEGTGLRRIASAQQSLPCDGGGSGQGCDEATTRGTLCGMIVG